MIDLLDMVKIKWSTRNKKYYTDKSYIFTKFGDEFSVYIRDLPKNSNIKVPVRCDNENCDSHVLWTPYRNYNKIIEERGVYYCKSCVIKQNHDKNIEAGWEGMYQYFLDKCVEHNCIPITTFDEFHGCDTDMKYICSIHGETSTLMTRIRWNNAWCYQCGKMHMAEKQKLSSKRVKEIVESKNNNILLNAEEYIRYDERNLKVICGSCNEMFITSLSAIQNGDGRCSDCGCRVAGDLFRTTKEEMIKMATIDGEIMVLNSDDYIGMHSPLLFKCSECGESFLTTPHNYIKRFYTKCDNCKTYSKGEEVIDEVLNKYDILHIRQKRYDDCKDKKTLPFDFYLPDYNSLIEFNGKQHYEPIEYFGGQEKLEYIQRHDRIKSDYALLNKIDLLIISYLEFNNIEQILINKYNLE